VAKYTAAEFIAAIPNTGGIVSVIAKAVGCDWHTAKRYIDDHSSVHKAWEAERHSVTDRARHNILIAITDDKDLQMSKWWLQVMDDEFIERNRTELTGKGGAPLHITLTPVTVGMEDED